MVKREFPDKAGRAASLPGRPTVYLCSDAGVDLIVRLAGRSKVASHSLDNNRGGFLGIPPKVLGLTPLFSALSLRGRSFSRRMWLLQA